MGYQPLEKLLPRSKFSVYNLVLIAARRATELADGKPPLIDFPSSPKTTTIALDEIMEGKVGLKGTIDEGDSNAQPAADAKEEAEKKE